MSSVSFENKAAQAQSETPYNTVPHSVLAAGFGSVESLVRAYSDIRSRLSEAGYPTVDQLFKTHEVLMQDNLALRARLAKAECQLSSVFKDTTLPYEPFPVSEESGLQNS